MAFARCSSPTSRSPHSGESADPYLCSSCRSFTLPRGSSHSAWANASPIRPSNPAVTDGQHRFGHRQAPPCPTWSTTQAHGVRSHVRECAAGIDRPGPGRVGLRGYCAAKGCCDRAPVASAHVSLDEWSRSATASPGWFSGKRRRRLTRARHAHRGHAVELPLPSQAPQTIADLVQPLNQMRLGPSLAPSHPRHRPEYGNAPTSRCAVSPQPHDGDGPGSSTQSTASPHQPDDR